MSAASIFLLGDAVGHVRQMLITGNFAPGTAGVVLYGHYLPNIDHCSFGEATEGFAEALNLELRKVPLS